MPSWLTCVCVPDHSFWSDLGACHLCDDEVAIRAEGQDSGYGTRLILTSPALARMGARVGEKSVGFNIAMSPAKRGVPAEGSLWKGQACDLLQEGDRHLYRSCLHLAYQACRFDQGVEDGPACSVRGNLTLTIVGLRGPGGRMGQVPGCGVEVAQDGISGWRVGVCVSRNGPSLS
jgi:hypothetical protein